MFRKGRGSDEPGRGDQPQEGRGRLGRRRSTDDVAGGAATDPWTDGPWPDDQWDDGWSDRDRARPARRAAGPQPQQVDAWLESDPESGDVTRDIAQRWTGAEVSVPTPGGTWSDDPVETWSDDERDERPAAASAPTEPAARARHAAPARPAAPAEPAAAAPAPPAPTIRIPSFESLDDDPVATQPVAAAPVTRRPEPGSPEPTSLFAGAIEESLDAPVAEASAPEPTIAAEVTEAPAVDTNPFEGDTFAAEPTQRVRFVPRDGQPEPSDDAVRRPTARPAAVRRTVTVLAPAARRTARLLGTAAVAAAAIRALLTFANVGATHDAPLLDRLARLVGPDGAAYAVALVIGVALLAVSRSDEEPEPTRAFGLALGSALAMALGAVLSIRHGVNAADGIGLVAISRIGAAEVGTLVLTAAAALAVLRATDDR